MTNLFNFSLKKKLKILDFDLEARPLSYLGSDFTTNEITAIGVCFVDDLSSMKVWQLGKHSSEEMLVNFMEMYNQADIVTGHYIRNFDLPQISGALMEFNLPPLGPKLTSDTKNDLNRRRGISASQENLSEMFELTVDKYHMSQIAWRKANRLTKEGLILTEKRVSGDVLQHMLLREEMIRRKILHPPKLWKP